MKNKLPKSIEKYRIKKGIFKSCYELDGMNGNFIIPYKRHLLKVIISDRLGWDHVSVSMQNMIPTWRQMCYIKDVFFEEEETVIQFHPPKSQYINECEFCLHLWRQQGVKYELPPSLMIGHNYQQIK